MPSLRLELELIQETFATEYRVNITNDQSIGTRASDFFSFNNGKNY
ncbi:MAG: hypothetical protein N2235_09550 [Fischerella sp.]|nr:hypothetical protein [Fischerella sp.]